MGNLIPSVKIGSWTRNNEQKAKRFAEYLKDTFQPNEGDGLEEWNDIYGDEMDMKFVTPKKIQKKIQENINPKKLLDLIS